MRRQGRDRATDFLAFQPGRNVTLDIGASGNELDGLEIDLEPVAREAVLLELPLAPLCREDCEGLCDQCGADRNEDPGHAHEAPGDARWSALDSLRFDE